MPDTSQTESSKQNRLSALRESIERLLDSERLLPADGQALLEMLQQAEDRIELGDTGEAGGLLLGFEALLRALADSGVLDPAASEHCVVKVRVAAAALSPSCPT